MTRRALLLHLLREAGDRGITTSEMLQAGVGSRYSARLLELREQGHVVTAERIRDGAWRYTLVRDVEDGECGVENGTVGMESLTPPIPASADGAVPGVERAPSSSTPAGAADRTVRARLAPDAPCSAAAPSRLFDPPAAGGYADVETAA